MANVGQTYKNRFLQRQEVKKIVCCQLLEKTLESPLDSKEIKPVNLKDNQP